MVHIKTMSNLRDLANDYAVNVAQDTISTNDTVIEEYINRYPKDHLILIRLRNLHLNITKLGCTVVGTYESKLACLDIGVVEKMLNCYYDLSVAEEQGFLDLLKIYYSGKKNKTIVAFFVEYTYTYEKTFSVYNFAYAHLPKWQITTHSKLSKTI